MHRITQLGFAWAWLILVCWLVAGWINGLGVSFQWLAWIPDTAWLLIALPGAMLVVVSKVACLRQRSAYTSVLGAARAYTSPCSAIT